MPRDARGDGAHAKPGILRAHERRQVPRVRPPRRPPVDRRRPRRRRGAGAHGPAVRVALPGAIDGADADAQAAGNRGTRLLRRAGRRPAPAGRIRRAHRRHPGEGERSGHQVSLF